MFTSILLNQIRNHYDVRSTTLNNNDVFLLGASFGSEIIAQGGKNVIISYDRRKNSKILHDNCIEGLLSSGVNVISIGRTTTAVTQIAEIAKKAAGSITITASHNFPDYHGLKFFLNKKPFAGPNLAKLVDRIIKKDFHVGKGKLKTIDFGEEYATILSEHVQIKGLFSVALDFLNGTAADIFPYIKNSFRGTYYVLNHKHDHDFSGFAPDPTYEPRLKELKMLIKQKKLDFGIAFDGDCDRCVVIDQNTNIVSGDKLLALFAYCSYQIKRKIIKIVWDSKSSNLLIDWAKPFTVSNISATGYPNIYDSLVNNNADIAGECSGHYIFQDFFCVNDGIYTALKLINMLEAISEIRKQKFTLNDALNELPHTWVMPSRNIACKNDSKEEIMNQLIKIAQKKSLTFDVQDGIKIHYVHGWCLIRPSNTEEILRVSAEGWTKNGLDQVKDEMNALLSEIENI